MPPFPFQQAPQLPSQCLNDPNVPNVSVLPQSQHHAGCLVQPVLPYNSFPGTYQGQNNHAQRLNSPVWTPGQLNANASEFQPFGVAGAQLPYNTGCPPQNLPPSQGLLGSCLPGFITPGPDNRYIDEFSPLNQPSSQDVVMSGGTGMSYQSAEGLGQHFPGLGAQEQPFVFGEMFTAETLHGLRTGNAHPRWGADGEEVFHTPQHTPCASSSPFSNVFGPSPFSFHSSPNVAMPYPQVPPMPLFSERSEQPVFQQCFPSGPPPPPPPPFGGSPNPAGHPYLHHPQPAHHGQGPPVNQYQCFPCGPAGPPVPPGGPPFHGGPGFPNHPGHFGPPGPFGQGPPGHFGQAGPFGPGPPGPGFGGGGQPRPKRWLPPPAWTPGVPGGLSYREWLWSLSGWARLTAMSHEDRGIAVAMSLGGRAGRLARTLPQHVLAQPQGLFWLLQRLESDLGAELQDRVRTANRDFRKYVRPKSMSASEFIIEWERRYQEARAHGLTMSITMLAMALVEAAQLSPSEESWVLQCVGGDWTQYDAIRRALRRLPSLDVRHQDSSAWLANSDGSSSVGENSWQNPRKPFQDGGLNAPPPEFLPHQQPQSASENQPDYYNTENASESDSDDDYVSSCPSNEDPETAEALVTAFAILHRRKRFNFKQTGKRPFRKGFKRPSKTWLADGQRNANDTIPPGWNREKWLARSKCPGCGSRFHRDCRGGGQTGGGKTFAAFRKKGKGHGKGHSKGHHKGGSSFGVFFASALSLLSTADSFVCQPCLPNVYTAPQFEYQNLCSSLSLCSNESKIGTTARPQMFYDCNSDNFETTLSPVSLSLFQQTECPTEVQTEANVLKAACCSVPRQMPADHRVFHAFHLPEIRSASLNQTNCCIIGLEPLDQTWREQQYTCFNSKALQRFALLLDTGAPQSAAGANVLDRFINDYSLHSHVVDIPFTSKLSGIGSGSASVTKKQRVPTGMYDSLRLPYQGFWETQRLEGIGKDVPFLLGLESMFKLQMLIDLQNPDFPQISCLTETGRKTFNLLLHSGHIVLPIDWGGKAMPSKQQYLSDPLGLKVWFGDQSSEDEVVSTTTPTITPNPPINIEPPPGLESIASDAVSHELRQETETFTANTHPTRRVPKPQPVSSTYRAPTIIRATNNNNNNQALSKEKESDEKIQNFHPTVDNAKDLRGATYAVLKRLRLSAQQQMRIAQSETYKRKYKPLPPLSPVPSLDNISPGTWHLWEWWAGCANLTNTARTTAKLIVGPPITRECGWDLSLPHHQLALLHLQDRHKPIVLFAGPTCAPWSQACTTMQPDLHEAILLLEEQTFFFFATTAKKQHDAGRYHLYEQPRNSRLLKCKTALDLANYTQSTDQTLCMCMHGLVSQSSGLPHMKPTLLRGTVFLSSRTLIWCDRSHKHEQLNGKDPSGKLRTSLAQKYTVCFCKRLSRDIKAFLNGSDNIAFPLNEDDDELEEFALEDPYGSATVDKQPLPVPKPTASRVFEPKIKTTKPAVMSEPGVRSSGGASASTDNPVNRQIQAWDEELAEAIAAGNRAADELALQSASDLVPYNPATDLVPVQPLVVAKVTPIPDEANKSMFEVCKLYSQRLANGVTATIQAGPRMRLLQELFGTPFNIQIQAAVIAKKPASSMPPEPLISRRDAPLLKEVFQLKDKEIFSQSKWAPYSTSFYGKRKPLWVIYLYGSEKAQDPVLINPYQELADLQQDSLRPLRELPAFLKAITEGTPEERSSLILALHKRQYHRDSKQIKKMLNASGVPLHILSHVDDIINSCEVCRAFAAPGAKPLAKLGVAGRFNQTIYVDLIFFDSVILFIGVDECTRYTVLAVAEYKSYDSLESVFRQNWIRHFGAPGCFRSDRESAFNSDKFAVYLSTIGTKLELVTAKDQHTWLGVLDRRVQIVRQMYPMLLRDMGQQHLFISHDDCAAECQIAINTNLTLGGISPYQMLYGTPPGPVFDEGLEYVYPLEAHNIFYEHNIARAKAIACFHQALIDQRLERNLQGRNRTTVSQLYSAGQLVDFYRKPERKQLEGWRGPAVVLAPTGEGYITLRWQSHNLDIPVNHIRPHILLHPTTPLGTIAPSNPSAVVPPVVIPAIASEPPVPVLTDTAAHVLWEQYWFSEASDYIPDESFLTLVSVVATMPIGRSVVHGISVKNSTLQPSAAAQRDFCVLYNLGKEAAKARAIPNYLGFDLVSGKRHAAQQPGVQSYHCFWWIGDASTAVLHHANVLHQVDFISLGVQLQELSSLRALVFFEGHAQAGPPLHELLQFQPDDMVFSEPAQPARVRLPFPAIRTSPVSSELPATIVVDDTVTTRAVSLADADDQPLSASEIFAMQLRGITPAEMRHETYIAHQRCSRLRQNLSSQTTEGENVFYSFDCHEDSFPSRPPQNQEQEIFCYFGETDNSSDHCFYPLEKDCRPLTQSEIDAHSKEVTAAELKELESWVKHNVGKPTLKSEFESRTGLRAMSPRMLRENNTKEIENVFGDCGDDVSTICFSEDTSCSECTDESDAEDDSTGFLSNDF